jgi:hypothetical protein
MNTKESFVNRTVSKVPKKILKIAGGVKQLTVPLLPDPNCSMPKNDAQCVIPVS